MVVSRSSFHIFYRILVIIPGGNTEPHTSIFVLLTFYDFFMWVVGAETTFFFIKKKQ